MLEATSFVKEDLNEVKDIQGFVVESIENIEKDLLIISTEFGDWEDSRRRIDILCIDKEANLVVIELKRTEDGGHMELQSIRYAAMIANMTFDQAVRTYEEYLSRSSVIVEDAEQKLLKFLDWTERNEDDFANDVRIILVSADFSREITTAVLWLIEREIDIKCIRIQPYKDEQNIYLDIQQLIPLPETKDYQVKIREKKSEQRQARKEHQRDYSKFNITIDNEQHSKLSKRSAMILTIKKCIKNNISPDHLMKITRSGKWISVDKVCQNKTEFEAAYRVKNERYDDTRWFNADDELLIFHGKTYLYSNQQGKDTEKLIAEIFLSFPQLNGTIEKNID